MMMAIARGGRGDWRVAAMEEIPQVKTNREALKRILAMLVAMAEMGAGKLGAGGQFYPDSLITRRMG
jgi:hypothetical protein